MEKVIEGSKISFYQNDKEIMYIDYSLDDCIWYFESSDKITVTSSDCLYEPLRSIMKEDYIFSDEDILKCYKVDSKIVWYSDCYYDPDNISSIRNISSLNIEFNGNDFIIWCEKEIDKIIDRKTKNHTIGFSASGNGRYSKNIKTNFTFQDDFCIKVYQYLLESKVKVKK